jgi:dihydroneopterin aldolase/2-amino-4-hydroxy-6-hydroxymethyldihydropteridine diphosphokinase
MARVFIAVGSNIDPFANVPDALHMLKESVKLDAVSSFYQTEPFGNAEQPAFVNGVFLVSTSMVPRELKFGVLRDIEHRLGRIRTQDKCAPRTIDLDMVLYDDLIMDEPDMVIPDPDIYKRAYLAVPVWELDPQLIIPGGSITVSEIVDRMTYGTMRRLDELTDLLRSELNSGP